MDISDRPFTENENAHQEACNRLIRSLGPEEYMESVNGYLMIKKKMAKKIKKPKKVKY